ncbi:MAG: hypothetical protein K2Z81_01265 [Cyanobacteria bacterium]|nr:hypothetical protein [Cyanobacteriota bacterium]
MSNDQTKKSGAPVWVKSRWRWSKGKALWQSTPATADLQSRLKMTHELSYYLYFGDPDQGMASAKTLAGAEERIVKVTEWHRQNLEGLSDDEIRILLEDVRTKCSWRKKEPDQQSGNRARREAAHLKIQESYEHYHKAHGKEPSRNQLAILSGASKKTVSNWLARRCTSAVESQECQLAG